MCASVYVCFCLFASSVHVCVFVCVCACVFVCVFSCVRVFVLVRVLEYFLPGRCPRSQLPNKAVQSLLHPLATIRDWSNQQVISFFTCLEGVHSPSCQTKQCNLSYIHWRQSETGATNR